MTEQETYFTIKQVKQANKDAGYHFFDPGTMRFFHSSIGKRVYGGKHFITGEKREVHMKRLYTIRYINERKGIDTLGEFQGYRSNKSAKTALKRYLAQGTKEE